MCYPTLQLYRITTIIHIFWMSQLRHEGIKHSAQSQLDVRGRNQIQTQFHTLKL